RSLLPRHIHARCAISAVKHQRKRREIACAMRAAQRFVHPQAICRIQAKARLPAKQLSLRGQRFGKGAVRLRPKYQSTRGLPARERIPGLPAGPWEARQDKRCRDEILPGQIFAWKSLSHWLARRGRTGKEHPHKGWGGAPCGLVPSRLAKHRSSVL